MRHHNRCSSNCHDFDELDPGHGRAAMRNGGPADHHRSNDDIARAIDHRAGKRRDGVSSRFGDATAQVVVETCDGTISGTAFAVDDRHLVTNQHVVGDAQKVALHQRDGSVVLGEVIAGNTLVDVAVIEVPAGTFTVVTKWGDSSKVLEGQPLTIIGYPGKGDYDVVEVSVRSIAKDATELRVTSGIDHGNSGSPAISEDGVVMGIARSSGVVVSIENYGSLIPSSLAQAIVNGMIARPDHTPRPVSCETKSVATNSPRTTR